MCKGQLSLAALSRGHTDLDQIMEWRQKKSILHFHHPSFGLQVFVLFSFSNPLWLVLNDLCAG